VEWSGIFPTRPRTARAQIDDAIPNRIPDVSDTVTALTAPDLDGQKRPTGSCKNRCRPLFNPINTLKIFWETLKPTDLHGDLGLAWNRSSLPFDALIYSQLKITGFIKVARGPIPLKLMRSICTGRRLAYPLADAKGKGEAWSSHANDRKQGSFLGCLTRSAAVLLL